MHVINFLMAEVQLFTLGPWVYWFLINGASQPGGQDGTALLPLFDMLNHDARQEVSLQTSRCSYTVLQINSRLCGHDTHSLVGSRRTGSVLEAAGKPWLSLANNEASVVTAAACWYHCDPCLGYWQKVVMLKWHIAVGLHLILLGNRLQQYAEHAQRMVCQTPQQTSENLI